MVSDEIRKQVLKLRKAGKTYREIQRVLRISPRDISEASDIDQLLKENEDLKKNAKQLRRHVREVADGSREIEEDRDYWKDLYEKTKPLKQESPPVKEPRPLICPTCRTEDPWRRPALVRFPWYQCPICTLYYRKERDQLVDSPLPELPQEAKPELRFKPTK